MGPLCRPYYVYMYIWAHYEGLIMYLFINVYKGVYIYGPTMYMGVVFYK